MGMKTNRFTAVLPNGASVSTSDWRRYVIFKSERRHGTFSVRSTDSYFRAADVFEQHDTPENRADGWHVYLWDNEAGPCGAVIDSTEVRAANGR